MFQEYCKHWLWINVIANNHKVVYFNEGLSFIFIASFTSLFYNFSMGKVTFFSFFWKFDNLSEYCIAWVNWDIEHLFNEILNKYVYKIDIFSIQEPNASASALSGLNRLTLVISNQNSSIQFIKKKCLFKSELHLKTNTLSDVSKIFEKNLLWHKICGTTSVDRSKVKFDTFP